MPLDLIFEQVPGVHLESSPTTTRVLVTIVFFTWYIVRFTIMIQYRSINTNNDDKTTTTTTNDNGNAYHPNDHHQNGLVYLYGTSVYSDTIHTTATTHGAQQQQQQNKNGSTMEICRCYGGKGCGRL